MRLLVLGGGRQGRAAAFDLLRREGVAEVVLADRTFAELPPYLAGEVGERLRLAELDARDRDRVRELLDGTAACLCALPYYLNLEMTRLAVEAGVHFCDLGGNTEIVRAQLDLDGEARSRGVCVVPDCGLAPGMVNILAVDGIASLDRTDAVRIRVGGLPREPEPPLNYQIVYSLEGVLDYYTTDAAVLREGRVRPVESLTGLERVRFPEPVGELEAFFTAGGISTLPWEYEGCIREMDYKTLRYPGHAEIVRAVRDLGLLSTEPVRLDGVAVEPRRVFIACVEPRLRKPGGRDLVAMRVEVEGEKGGEPRRIVYELLDYYDEETGITAMERTTGFSLAITGLMLADGRIRERGVHPPHRCVPAREYVEDLAARGVRVRRREGRPGG